jgi:cyanophycinase-like exopeptidase
MRSDIKVSFIDNAEEDKLHDDIIDEITRLGASKAKWMKIAAREKLERDHGNQAQKINVNIPNANNTGGIIDSMDNWFKPQ